jgi:hypothetical protein
MTAIPKLVSVPANRLEMDDVIWGTKADNPRKGWRVDTEPVTVISATDAGGTVIVKCADTNGEMDTRAFHPADWLMLVEAR